MERRSFARVLIPVALAAGAAALVLAYARGLVLAAAIGLLLLVAALVGSLLQERATAPDPGRRRILAWAGLGGLAWIAGGAALGRTLRTLVRPDPRPALEQMASGLGAEYMELVRRNYRPDRAGELQLVLAPYNSANYANESRSLVPRDPRTSHASLWMYLERIPLAVYRPGVVPASDSRERVSLADVAPTIASMIGFEGFAELGREGRVLPGAVRDAPPPKLVVTFVIDGGGWNALHEWPDAWPTLRDLFRRSAVYRNAIHGSFPAVTAVAHATIGTGAFARDHGITGHNVRVKGSVRKAYGTPGRARPDDILIPTLADLWHDRTGAWVGEIGYQVWHLGMLGRGGTDRPPGDLPVGVFWDEDAELTITPQWQPHNPDLYRLPAETPGLEVYRGRLEEYAPVAPPPHPFDPGGRQSPCCAPPIVRYQGDLIEATIRSEGLGRRDATDLLFVNYKSPDYTGHIYNMLDDHERIVLEAVDEQLARLVRQLHDTFEPGEFALIVTADHGQCPLPDEVDGTRLDPIQLEADIERRFGRSVFGLVEYVAPAEIFLDRRALWDAGITPDEVAAFLGDYRYGENIGPYVPAEAIQDRLMEKPQFSAVFGRGYLASLTDAAVAALGETAYPEADPAGIPGVSW